MYLSNLDMAELCVSKHSNLIWDGWDIIELTEHPAAEFMPEGMFVDGVWYTHKRMSPSRDGWEISARYLGDI